MDNTLSDLNGMLETAQYVLNTDTFRIVQLQVVAYFAASKGVEGGGAEQMVIDIGQLLDYHPDGP